ncbi:hypothetical protein Psi01_83820 [Planobispora siamensis]|uniref:Uncharacterized protein n=1 Tax=Planobispora siamensis TaxID=936338 RepID=A0A8J3SRW7_9ACTN|nr:hypothetical protein Psi01_83820 [Planobispora siamensis]
MDLAALDAAMPCGIIWHSQACCSAGAEGPSKYMRLLVPGTSAALVVEEMAKLGTVQTTALSHIRW